MARAKAAVPSYTLHRPTGQARVRLNGKDHYLGLYGSAESRTRYAELISQPQANPSDPIAPHGLQDAGPAVAELVLTYLRFAQTYYVKDGKPTDEVACFKSAVSPLVTLFGVLPSKDFGPLQLQVMRTQYIAAGWTRRFCNASVNGLRRIWKWGVSQELVPVTTWHALTTVAPLKAGKCDAPDRPKRQAVPRADLMAVKRKLTRRCRAMFDLLRFTGARPSEIRMLEWSMLDQSLPVWSATMNDHKTAHKGKIRVLHFGPRAQRVLRRLKRNKSRKITVIGPDTLSEAMRDACDELAIDRFSPYHLRHCHGTTVRDELGHEHAQAALGHAAPDTTAIYTSKLDKLASEAAAKCG